MKKYLCVVITSLMLSGCASSKLSMNNSDFEDNASMEDAASMEDESFDLVKVDEVEKVEKEEKKVYIDEEVEEEAPKPKTAIEKLEYNSEKALERVDYYERVVRSVAREEEELKEYKNTVKNKK